jgi:hypothetical protein
MATFPSIFTQPPERQYQLPTGGSSETVLLTGVKVIHKRGSLVSNAPFSFLFTNLTLTRAQLISTHYRGERKRGFQIPVDLWANHDSLYDVVPAVQEYRYNSPPSRRQNAAGLYDVTVELVTMF